MSSLFVGFDDIDTMLSIVGVPIVLGDLAHTTTNCIFRQHGEEVLQASSGASLVSSSASALIKKDSLGTGALEQALVTIGAQVYSVRAALPIEDGAVIRLLLVEHEAAPTP